MSITLSDSPPYLRRSFRLLTVLGASAAAALAVAGPALAEEVPIPEPPPTVETLAPETIPLPALPPPELAEPPVVVTTIDASSIDVSVRVLSPGEEPREAQPSETPLVSGELAPDITALPDAEDALDEAAPESPGPGSMNTNVSVRILSPGDRGDVDQLRAGGGEGVVEAGARPSESSEEPPPTSSTHGDSKNDSAQYHGDNSLEQFDFDAADAAWNWTWSLAIDCAGNVVSSSADIGDSASLIWSWSWGWTWGCSGAPTPDPTPSSSPQPPEPPSDELAGVPVSTEAPGEPWAWTWTFTFCGETTTISTNAGAGTPLTWTWDWSWTWFCPLVSPAETTPAPGVDEWPAPDPQPAPFLPQPDTAPNVPFPPLWLPSAPPELEAGITTEIVVVPPFEPTPLVPLVEIVIPAVVLPIPTTAPSLPVPELSFPPEVAAGPTTTNTGPGARRAVPHSPQPTPTIARQQGLTAQLPPAAPRAHQARPAKQKRVRGARTHRPLPPLPFERPQPQQAAGGAGAGGLIPSTLLFGVAALTGLIVLAAPGLGRRIRLARELSPRGLNESPLDRPG